MNEIEIIPAINAKTFTEAEEKIRLIEPYVSWAHVDVADSSFTDVSLWHDPKDLFTLRTPLFIELHLMIADVDKRIQEWLQPLVRRIIFHREASEHPEICIAACRGSDIQVGMSIIPSSPIEGVLPYLSRLDLIQTLGVTPGHSGQTFEAGTLQKITALHSACPACPIEADGGVRTATAAAMVKAGASILVAGSAIFSAPDIKTAIEKLKSSVSRV